MSPLRLRIRELRLAYGWTQEELAERAGIRRVTVNRIEKGHSQGIEFDVLDRLARALQTDPGLLFVRTESEDAEIVRPQPRSSK